LAIYEIINPSDAYSLESDDFAVACVITCLLGEGKYGLMDAEGDTVMPILLFGTHEKWFPEQFGKTLKQLLDEISSGKLADCMDSVVIGDAKDRVMFYQAINLIDDPIKKQEWRNAWHNKKRSSLNDIGGYAKVLAAHLRKAKDVD